MLSVEAQRIKFYCELAEANLRGESTERPSQVSEPRWKAILRFVETKGRPTSFANVIEIQKANGEKYW